MTPGNRLAATVGGKALDLEGARTLWERFSAYMDVHRNDFEGFARSEGWAHASVVANGEAAMLTLANEAPPPAKAGGSHGGGGRPKGKGRARR